MAEHRDATGPHEVDEERLTRFGERLLAEQTPEHRAHARLVFSRLSAGADVDDVRELIKQFPRGAADRPASYRR